MRTVVSPSASVHLCVQGSVSCAVMWMVSVGDGVLRFTVEPQGMVLSVFSDASGCPCPCPAPVDHIPALSIDHG